MAETMGYNPAHHTIARRLALHNSKQRVINHVIALFTAWIDTRNTRLPAAEAEYHRKIIFGITEVCREQLYAVLLSQGFWRPDQHSISSLLPSAFARGDTDGAIFIGQCGLIVSTLRGMPGFDTRPIVSLFVPYADSSTILTDDRSGTYAATQHLLSTGHRHLLVLYSPDEDPIVQARLSGMQDALADAGSGHECHLYRLNLPTTLLSPITAPRVLPLPGAPAQHVEVGADILLPFLRQHPEITAIFCQNDAMALHLWHMLHHAGWRIPEDISLIGFDDTDGMLDSTGVNHLTTIRLPLYEVGRAAAEVMIQRITGELTEDVQRVLPVEFVVRHSTR